MKKKLVNSDEFFSVKFPQVDKTSWFYKNCKQQRKKKAKICQVCPFREGIELQEGE